MDPFFFIPLTFSYIGTDTPVGISFVKENGHSQNHQPDNAQRRAGPEIKFYKCFVIGGYGKGGCPAHGAALTGILFFHNSISIICIRIPLSYFALKYLLIHFFQWGLLPPPVLLFLLSYVYAFFYGWTGGRKQKG